MSQLNESNILDCFYQITGVNSEEFTQYSVISNARQYVESRLVSDELTDEQVEQCEYAAAVYGAYEYILARNGAEKIVISQSGRAVSSQSDADAVSAVSELKRAVFGSLKDLIDENRFSFIATGGE